MKRNLIAVILGTMLVFGLLTGCFPFTPRVTDSGGAGGQGQYDPALAATATTP